MLHVIVVDVVFCSHIFKTMASEDLLTSRQVLEYLSKKGYSRTEAMLRLESASTDREGRPLQTKVETAGPGKYSAAFSRLSFQV